MKVTKGRIHKPFRLLIYGTSGVGKSTLAAHAPKPIFFDPTSGTAELDVVRYDEAEWTFSKLFEAIEEVAKSKEFETLVIDELGAFEQLAWNEVCKAGKKAHILEFDWGKGYSASLDKFRKLTVVLEQLASKKNVILIGHSKVSQFNNPEGNDYHRYVIQLHEKVAGLLFQWSDACLFCRYEEFTGETEKKKLIGMSTGERVVHTTHKAAYDCKNRYNLPEQLSMSDPDLLYQLIRDGQDAKKLTAKLQEFISRMKDEDAEKCKAAIAKSKDDSTKLMKILNWARTREEKKS